MSTSEYVWARKRQLEFARELERFWEGIDFVVTPVIRVSPPAQDADAISMAKNLTAFTAPFNVTGLPAISVPCGFTSSGLPIGLQIVGDKWQEARILQVAHQYQLVTEWHTRVPPLA